MLALGASARNAAPEKPPSRSASPWRFSSLAVSPWWSILTRKGRHPSGAIYGKADQPVVVSAHAPRIGRVLDAARVRGVGLVVIDTPSRFRCCAGSRPCCRSGTDTLPRQRCRSALHRVQPQCLPGRRCARLRRAQRGSGAGSPCRPGARRDGTPRRNGCAGDAMPAHRPRSRLHGRLVGHGVPGAVQSSRRTRSPLPLKHRRMLSSALSRAAGARRAPEPAPPRKGLWLRLEPAMHKRLRLLAVQEDTTVQQLGVEALEMLLQSRAG